MAMASALASLALLLAALRRRAVRTARRTRPWIFVDGSNVMHWKGEGADIVPVVEVLARLKALGYVPGVVFDANAGYKLQGRYLHDGALAKLLGLPASQVLVAPRGTPADPLLLAAARDSRARIVTNDRFREWSATHPEVAAPGYLVRGDYRGGQLRLDLDPAFGRR